MRAYAWKPDLPDHRDHLFSVVAKVQPDHIDRIGMSVAIDDQGQLGSCTGNSSTAAVEIVTGRPPLSRLMAYYNGRALEGTTAHDDGAQIRDVVKGIQKHGVCLETLWPYDVAKFATKPSAKAVTEAKELIPAIASYQRVLDLHSLKAALVVGLPVVFGFSVPDYFESQEMASGTEILRLPTAADKMIGGHAVVAVGYDDRGGVPFIWVRNSWGVAWGVDGYFKMDARWFTDPRRLVDDMWVFHPAAA